MGDIQLSDMKATYYPPALQPGFMGAHPPVINGYGSNFESGNISYFQNYRNENISKFQMPPYEWGMMSTPYSPKPDIACSGMATNWDKILNYPRTGVSMLDAARQQEVDDFYKASQMHRDQYKDHTGRLHPLDYFKKADFAYQCPPNLTDTYLKCPQKYIKYKSPQVLPLTLERTLRVPYLPERALTGRYEVSSDFKFKR